LGKTTILLWHYFSKKTFATVRWPGAWLRRSQPRNQWTFS